MLRPAIAARVSSTKPASLRVSLCSATGTPCSPGHRQRGVDRRGRRPPVLVQLEAARAGPQLLGQRGPRDRVALAEQRDVDRQRVHRLEHPGQVPVAGRDRGGLRPLGRPGAAADQRGHARAERRRDDLRADEVDVAVDAAGGEDLAVARQHLGAGPDDQVRVDAVHRVGVAGLAERDDPAVADADVGLDDAPVVEDDGAGDDQVGSALGAGRPALAHRLADHLAAAEHRLLAGPAGTAAAGPR